MFHHSFEDSIKTKQIIPIHDMEIKDDNMGFSMIEARCKLASLCRLIDLYQWSQSIYNHVTMRLPGTNLLLINPFGLLFSEITASNLVSIDLNGQIIKTELSEFGVNKAGCVLHSAIHQIRQDVNCIIHVHTSPIVAVSCFKDGLLPISQEAIIVGDVSYYTYQGIAINDNSREIANALGPKNKVMILRNHGAICVGSTVEEAFYWLFNLYIACQHQVCALSCGSSNLIFPDKNARDQVRTTISKGYEMITTGGIDTLHWGFGELEYEAHMRTLDRYGFKTGYKYKFVGSIINPKTKRSSIVAKKINFNKNHSSISTGTVCSDESISVAYSVDSGAHILIENDQMDYDSDNLLVIGSGDDNAICSSSDSVHKKLDTSIPRSESSREMIIRYGSQSLTKMDELKESFPYPEEGVPAYTGSSSRSHTRHESLQRRSKSLTSGVERAIYRRINEKYRCEVK